MLAYALTIFVGAFLLFQVQPLIGRYLLPWFGGAPSVWTTCLFFFQTFLVAGYVYAHCLARFCRPRMQALIHVAMLMAALASLPIVPSPNWKPKGPDHPSAAILLLLACNLGVPYLVLAATGPLVQYWSNRSTPASSPYPLYALSNLGSLLALISYPLVFEAHLSRKSQALFWQCGLFLYTLCCGWCAVSSAQRVRAFSRQGSIAVPTQATLGPLSPGQRLLWLLWPACASVLLIAVTNKLCLDVAVFPLLWVLPLAVYLASFIICFAGPRFYPRLPFLLALGCAMVGFVWALFAGAGWPFWKQLSVYTGALFVCCVVCHGELFRIRPAPRALTEFYLLIATGGALGGLFASIAAPRLFTNYYELHWGVALCGFLVIAVRTYEHAATVLAGPRSQAGDPAKSKPLNSAHGADTWKGLEMASLWLWFFALAVALWIQSRHSNSEIVYNSRNFYGVLTVFEHRKDEPTGHHFLLQHGRITHGFQFVHPQLQSLPTTYYGPDSGLGLALAALPLGNRRIGVVGLGTGTIAAYGRPGDFFEFYEINPQVSCLATSIFRYLALERQIPQQFDLVALDAFNSDSIPVHLLTREAFKTYLRHLKPNGVLAVHTSNHFLNLEPVVAGLAREFGLQSAVVDHDAKPEQWWIYSSTWVLLSRDPRPFEVETIRSATKNLSTSPSPLPVWTDDYSSLFQILR
jgi:hypothetical protein